MFMSWIKTELLLPINRNKNMTGFEFYDEYYDIVMNNKEGKFSCNLQNIDSMAFFTTLTTTGFKMVEVIPSKVLYRDKE